MSLNELSVQLLPVRYDCSHTHMQSRVGGLAAKIWLLNRCKIMSEIGEGENATFTRFLTLSSSLPIYLVNVVIGLITGLGKGGLGFWVQNSIIFVFT